MCLTVYAHKHLFSMVCVCVYSNSRNDVPRVAQRYGTIAAHTRRRASVLVVFVVFCVHMHSFAGLIRRTPPPTFSDTAITDRHSDTTIFQLRAHWVRISWSIGSEKSFGHVPPVGFSMVSLCCLLYTEKILKGERLKIITIIVLKVEHFYNALMQPKWQINTELNDFRKIICLTKSKVFV